MAEKQAAMTEAVYYILLSLQTPNHGYGIIQNTLELTGEDWSWAPGRSMEPLILYWISSGFGCTVKIRSPERKSSIF